jgi:hypothetical protein
MSERYVDGAACGAEFSHPPGGASIADGPQLPGA